MSPVGPQRRSVRPALWGLALLVVGLLLATPLYAQEDGPPGPSELPDALEDARRAVIRVEAFGGFTEPEGLRPSRQGSGFILDPSGLAVTSSRVVVGASFIKVRLVDEERPRQARLVGYAECADLALIDIAGEDFPTLEWSSGRIRVGSPVYAAGFPLDDRDLVLVPGTVVRARIPADTPWASVSQGIVHDAPIDPGSTGGPLLDAQGRVVGVNHVDRLEDGPSLAISGELATSLVGRLSQGQTVPGLGINGQARMLEDSTRGIWVASVDPGSPADDLGLEAGDLLLTMAGMPLAPDGTKATYCELLRGREAGDTPSIRVLRTVTGEPLVGQVGGHPLQPAPASARLLLEGVAPSDPEIPDTPESGYDAYTAVTDDAGVIRVELPAAWSRVRGVAWKEQEVELGYSLAAAADLDAFYNTWSESGVFIGVSQRLAQEYSPAEYLDTIDLAGICTYDHRIELSDGPWAGYIDLWTDCGDERSSFANIALAPPGRSFLVLVQMVMAQGARDLDALDHLLATLSVALDEEAMPESDLFDPREQLDLSAYETGFDLFQDPALTLLVPTAWSDRRREPWLLDGQRVGRRFYFAPDVEGFLTSWTVPGMAVYVSPTLAQVYTPTQMLDVWTYEEDCTLEDRFEYTNTVGSWTYQGAMAIWTECGGEGAVTSVLAAVPPTNDHLVLVVVQSVSLIDVEALEVGITSFYVPDPQAALRAFAPGIAAAQVYTSVQALEGYLAVEVPAAWGEVASGLWTQEPGQPPLGVRLWAAPDLEQYRQSWSEPGLMLAVVPGPEMARETVLAAFRLDEFCVYDDRYPVERSRYSGEYDLWVNCGNTGTVWAVAWLRFQEDAGPIAVLAASIPDGQAFQAFEHALATLQVDPEQELEALMARLDRTEARPALGPELAVGPTATVTVRALNVREGPGTDYERVGVVSRGDRVRVMGQVDGCAWLKVVVDRGMVGWIAGSQRFVALSQPCEAIPRTQPPTQPQDDRQGLSGAGNPDPHPELGCYLFENRLEAEVTVTVVRPEDGWTKAFPLAQGTRQEECFEPGRYTYTLAAPPPWTTAEGELEVQPGDRYLFPIRSP